MEYNGVEYIHIETLAEYFGDFVLKLVKEELDRQSRLAGEQGIAQLKT